MICEKCGVENAERHKFCTGCAARLKSLPPEEAQASVVPESVGESELREFPAQPEINYSTPIPVKRATVAATPYDPANEKIGVPSFGPNYAERKGKSGKFLLIGGITLALLLLFAGAILWRQMPNGGEQSNEVGQNTPAKTASNSTADSVSALSSYKENSAPKSTAVDEFMRLEAKLADGAAKRKSPALEREIRYAEIKYPEDYRFTYQRAKIEAAAGRGHHESFEMLYGAGRKAVKAGKSAELLSDLEMDGNSTLKRLTDHKEWIILENALLKNNSKALEEKGGHEE